MANPLFDFLNLVDEGVRDAAPLDFTRPLGESAPYRDPGPSVSGPSLRGVKSAVYSPEKVAAILPTGRPNYGVFKPGDSDILKGGGAGTVTKGAVFPERIGINLVPVWDALLSSHRTLLGNLKLIPGNPLGEVFRGLGESGLGQAVGALGEAITSPFRSIDYLMNTPLKGQNIFETSDPWAQLQKNLELNAGILGAGADIITSAVGGGAVVKVAGKTAAGKLVGGIFNPFKGASGRNALAWVVAPVARKEFQAIGKREIADAYATAVGRTIGRVGLVGLTVGTVEHAAIKSIAPDSWAAKEIADNRFVPEGDPWEGVLDLALAAPLDFLGAAGRARKFMLNPIAERVFGEINVLDKVIPNWKTALDRGVVSLNELRWFNSKALRDTAMWSLIDDANREIIAINHELATTAIQTGDIAGAKKLMLFTHPAELNFGTQDAYDQAIRARMKALMDLPAAERTQMMADTINGVGEIGNLKYRPGFGEFVGLSEANRLINLSSFYQAAKALDPVMDGRILTVNYEKFDHLISQAVSYLRKSDGSAESIQGFKAQFPSLAEHAKGGISAADIADKIERIGEGLAQAPYSVKLGGLKAQRDKIVRQLLAAKGDTKALQAERADLERQIKAINKRVANDFYKSAELHSAVAKAKAEEMLDFDWGVANEYIGFGKAYFDAAIEEAERIASANRIAGLQAEHILGSRYMLDEQPYRVMQKVFDEEVRLPKGRTAAGKVFDRLFGGIPNMQIASQAHKDVIDGLMAKGFSSDEARGVLNAIHEFFDQQPRREFKTGFVHRKYGSIFNLPHEDINRITREHAVKAKLADAKVTDWYEIFAKSYPGPLKIFQKQVFGKALDIPYNKTYYQLTRTWYPMFRFYASPRFIALNLLEPKFYETFFRERPPIRGWSKEQMRAMAEQRLGGTVGRGEDLVQQFDISIDPMINLAYSKRYDEWTRALMNTLHSSPQMADYIKSAGIRSEQQLVQAVSDTINVKMDIISGANATLPAERELAKEVEIWRARVRSGLSEGADVEARATLEKKERQLIKMQIDRAHEIQEKLAIIPKEMEPFMEAARTADLNAVDAARQMLFGNPSRTAAERAMNSFLLYWPISYQIKATKILAEFMLSKGLGVKWNASPAIVYSQIHDFHTEKAQTDAEYASFFKNNRQALFLLHQLFPATPEEIGVSLSPVFRLPMQVARGYRTHGEAVEKFGDVGILYDWNLFQQIYKEQSKPGRMLHDLFSEE